MRYSFVKLIFFVVVLFCTILPNQINVASQSSLPDKIIINAHVVTMEPDHIAYTTVEITNGIITNLSNSTDPIRLNDPNIQIIDLGGYTLFPGFIDSHSHWIGDRDLYGLTIDQAIQTALSYGWTSISELFVNEGRLTELVDIDTNGQLKLRVNVYLPLNYRDQRFGEWYQYYSPHQLMSPKVRIGGVKFFMDNGPYFGYEGRNYWFNSTELNPLVKNAHDLGFQISIHCIVDNATDTALSALEAAQLSNPNIISRHRIEHGLFLRDDQFDRMSDLGVMLSTQLYMLTSDDIIYVEEGIHDNVTLGLIGRWKDAIDSGVKFIGSTDIPWVVSYDNAAPMNGVYTALTKNGFFNDTTPPEYLTNQSLTIEESLKSITIDGAYGTFEEDLKGSIKVGKVADFAVLSSNPLLASSSELRSIENFMTMIGGEIVYCKEGFESMCEGELPTSSSMSLTPSSTLTTPRTTSSSATVPLPFPAHIWLLSISIIVISRYILNKYRLNLGDI